jgi:hypothetical protein
MGGAGEGERQGATVSVGPHFKMVFLCVFGITVVLFLSDLVLSLLVENPNEHVSNVIGLCDTMAKAGLGGLIGLVSGRAGSS